MLPLTTAQLVIMSKAHELPFGEGFRHRDSRNFTFFIGNQMRHEKSRFIEVLAGGYIRESVLFEIRRLPSASLSIVQFFSIQDFSRRTEISRGIHRSFSYRCVHRHWCRLCHTFCSHFAERII